MSGLGLTLGTRRRRSASRAPAQDPTQILGSTLTAWLRVSQGTITGSGYSSIPDALNSNPAVQATDANRPTAATSNNGLPILTTTSSQFMTVPLIAANNGTTQWGIGFWARNTLTSTNRGVFAIDNQSSGPSSARKLRSFMSGQNPLFDVFNSGSTAARRVAGGATLFPQNVWSFFTLELDLASGQSEDKRAVVSSNGAFLSASSFSDGVGTAGSMPTLMPSPTGSMLLFAHLGNGTQCWVGNIGPNIYFFGPGMTGRSEGLLTPAARVALMNYQPPT